MNRCLHITIHENADGLLQQTSQQTTAFSPSRTGTDPGGDNTMPKPDDPTDPGGDNTMPKPDDPSDPPYPSGGMGAGAACGATVQACCCGCHCGCGAPTGTAPGSSTGASTPHPFIKPRDFSGFVIVRTAQGIDPNAASLWELANRKGRQFLGLQAVLELPFKTEEAAKKAKTAAKKDHLTSRPLVELQGQIGGAYGALGPLPRGECIQRLQDLEKETALTAFPPLHSLTAYWRLDLREHPDRVEEVVAGLNRLAEVDLAYRELSGNDPQNMPQDVPQDVPGGQLFAEDQGYLGDAPMGISASWVWEKLAETAPKAFLKLQTSQAHPLTVCDLEQGWNRGHQELKDLKDENGLQLPILYGANRNDEGTPGHHGTAVLGQLAATGTSPEGIKGAATGISQFVLASHYKSKDEKEAGNKPHPFAGTNGHVAAAIVQAVEKNAGALKEGDVLLLEIQRGLLPAETDEADFDAIRLASGLGVIVVEAAGNGGFNLDAYSDADTGRSFQRGTSHFRDSGAILVGAARASLPHDRAPFSNYGSRLDCFAWGETVTTCGFGDLAGTVDADLYTNSFNGTSSASPIIAGAAALVQALHKAQTGTLLQPQSMRTLLADPATGTRQGPNVPGFIGVMPDLRAIIRERLQLMPVVYMRRSVCDDGSKPEPDDEISSSPDILLRQEDLAQTAARYGEGNGRESLPAPGDPMATAKLNDAINNHLYIRLRNRGLSNGEAHVRLFASPAATLITPEHWIPWSLLDVVNLAPNSAPGIIPQGDTLFVAGPAAPVFTLTDPAPGTLWSFLAILTRPGDNGQSSNSNFVNWMASLPPVAPYFDWTRYRAFLRRQGVVWRNSHRVAATTASTVLPFFIAGTPDRARLFDFEVIQRLPEGATVTLQVPAALDAKLRQRQPWLGSGNGSLPTCPRTAIRGVVLAAGTYADATFTVQAAPNTLTGSHSLAIRQLWHGEEVGRITWYFGLDT
jgi:serine protease